MNAILLVKGEESKRIGVEKHIIKIDGKTILEIILENITQIFSKIIIVSICPYKLKNYQNSKIISVKDNLECGPLGAIYLGLKNSSTLYNFVFAVDMPFISVDFVKYMMEIEKNHDIIVPLHNKKLEVLHAIYSKNVILFIEENLKKKEYEVKKILDKVNVKYIKREEIKKFGNPEKLFFNLNTKDDLLKLKKWKD